MKISIAFSALSMLLLTACQSSQLETVNAMQSTQHISQGVYRIEFAAAQHFAQQAEQLVLGFEQYCRSPNTGLDGVKNQWQQTTLAWMALQGQERGPAKALEQSWNVQFWPDKKDTTGRKMNLLVKSGTLWTEQDIASQSVTVQGIGAIEWLLYDEYSPLLNATNSSENIHQVCEAAQAISQNLATKAQFIATQWNVNPWTALDAMAWEAEYIALLSNQLDYSMKKLSRPLANIGQPRPYFAESWRAKVSMNNLKANVAAMQRLYLADGGLDSLLRDKGLNDLADRVQNHFALMLLTWPTEPSLFDLLQNKEGYREVLSQYNKFEQLHYLLHDEVAVELGITIGFNATDGD